MADDDKILHMPSRFDRLIDRHGSLVDHFRKSADGPPSPLVLDFLEAVRKDAPHIFIIEERENLRQLAGFWFTELWRRGLDQNLYVFDIDAPEYRPAKLISRHDLPKKES